MSGHQLLMVAVSVSLTGAFLFQFAEKVTTFGQDVDEGGRGGGSIDDAAPPAENVLFARIVGLLMMIGGGLASGALILGIGG